MSTELVAVAADSPAPCGDDVPRAVGRRRNPDFTRLWAGQTISLFGSQVTELALPLTAILVLQATPGQVGLLSAAKFIPVLLISLAAGAWVDRRSRRSLMIATDFGRAALVALVPLSFALGMLAMWQLYLVAMLAGALTVLFDVAYLSYLPSLVDRDEIAAGNSKLQASASSASVAGPGLAGALIQTLSAPVALVVDACSYVASGMSLLRIRTREERPSGGDLAARSLRGEAVQGLSFVFREPRLRALAGEAATFNLVEDCILVVFLLYATRVLHLRPGALGLVLAAGGAGALLGSVAGGRAARIWGLGPTLLASMTAACLSPIVFLLPRGAGALTTAVLGAAFFVHGAGVAVGNVNVVTLRQLLTPDRLLGRMNASYRLLAYGAIPLGSFLGGALGEWVGLRPALAIGALALPSALLWVIFSPVPRLREVPGAVGATEATSAVSAAGPRPLGSQAESEERQ